MERLSCLQSIHGVEDSPYPHVFTDAALPEAIDAELKPAFRKRRSWIGFSRSMAAAPPDV